MLEIVSLAAANSFESNSRKRMDHDSYVHLYACLSNYLQLGVELFARYLLIGLMYIFINVGNLFKDILFRKV